MKINKLIITGWILYFSSLLIPWSGRPFSGWLFGWFWQLIDLLPFIRLITLAQVGLLELASTMAIIAGLIMWISPFLFILVNRGAVGFYSHLPFLGFILSLLSSCLKLYLMDNNIPHPELLYILGNLLWILSFGLIWRGFIRQLHYIKVVSLRT